MRDALHWVSTGIAVYWVDIKMSALMMPDTAVVTRTGPSPCRGDETISVSSSRGRPDCLLSAIVSSRALLGSACTRAGAMVVR